MSNQRPPKLQSSIDRRQSISPVELLKFLNEAIVALEAKGEIEAATRFEIMRDFVQHDVIESGKPFTFNHGISLGL